jgi:hypothetical protein
VAVVQVDIEHTAVRIESAVSKRKAITIQNTACRMRSAIEEYTLYKMPVGNDVQLLMLN